MTALDGVIDRAYAREKDESRVVRDNRSHAELLAGVGTVDVEP